MKLFTLTASASILHPGWALKFGDIAKKGLQVMNPLTTGNTNDKRDIASNVLKSVLPDTCADQFLYVGHLGRDEDDYPFTPRCAQSSSETMSCFPRGSEVAMADGRSALIEDLKIGDLVRCGDCSTGVTEVIGWLHRIEKTDVPRSWIEAKLENGSSLIASENHIVFARVVNATLAGGSSSKDIQLPMAALRANHRFMLASSEHGDDHWVGVTEVKRYELPEDRGLFAPLTKSGSLIVSNVTVSAFSSLSPKDDVRFALFFGAVEHDGWAEHDYIMKHRGGAQIISLFSHGWK